MCVALCAEAEGMMIGLFFALGCLIFFGLGFYVGMWAFKEVLIRAGVSEDDLLRILEAWKRAN